MLPAWCSTQTSRHDSSRMTVVVNPTVSLQEDLNRCCRAAGLQCVMWNPRHPHTKVSIMLVTVESAVTAGFITFLNRVHAIHCLNRIVIDECHAVFDGGAEFRPKLLRLSELWMLECQIVLLTALCLQRRRVHSVKSCVCLHLRCMCMC